MQEKDFLMGDTNYRLARYVYKSTGYLVIKNIIKTMLIEISEVRELNTKVHFTLL